MKTTKNYSTFTVLLSTLLLLIALLCSCSQNNKNIEGLKNIINNVDNYATFFKENNTFVEVVEDEDSNYLKVSWDNNIDAYYTTTLDTIHTNRECTIRGERYIVDVIIYDIDLNANTAQVKTIYDGGYGSRVCFYLPDFSNVKPDWGDYMNALLDVEEVISESELKELYQKAVEMETLMRDEIYQRNMQ